MVWYDKEKTFGKEGETDMVFEIFDPEVRGTALSSGSS